MSKKLDSSDIFPSDLSSLSVSDAISAAFGNSRLPTKPNSSESSFKKKFLGLKEKSKGAKDTFLTEAELNEIEGEMSNQGYTPLTYEEMIKELDELNSGVKSRKKDLEELKRRINKCQGDIQNREEGFNGIDKRLHDIKSQSKEGKAMLKKFRSMASFPKGRQEDI